MGVGDDADGALLGLASALGLAAGNLLMKRLFREVAALPAGVVRPGDGVGGRRGSEAG